MHETLHMTHTSTCDLDDTQNDTHIIAFAVLHLCCHTGSTIFCRVGRGSDPGSHPSSAPRKKENVLCREWILKKKAIPQKKDTLSILIALTAKEQTTTDGTNPEK